MDLATSPDELFMLIGSREFTIYRQQKRIEELEENARRLEQAHNELLIQYRGLTESPPEGPGRDIPLSSRPDEYGGRDDQARPFAKRKIPRES